MRWGSEGEGEWGGTYGVDEEASHDRVPFSRMWFCLILFILHPIYLLEIAYNRTTNLEVDRLIDQLADSEQNVPATSEKFAPAGKSLGNTSGIDIARNSAF